MKKFLLLQNKHDYMFNVSEYRDTSEKLMVFTKSHHHSLELCIKDYVRDVYKIRLKYENYQRKINLRNYTILFQFDIIEELINGYPEYLI